MTSDTDDAMLFAFRANIENYRKILGTHLTDDERDLVERRLAEERTELEKLADVTSR